MTERGEAAKADKVVGFLDEVTQDLVRGWAATPGRAEALLTRLFVDDVLVAEQRCREPRPDTKSIGAHPTGDCGFRFELPKERPLREGQRVRVVAASSQQELHGSPCVFRGAPVETSAHPRLFFMHIAKTAGTTLNEFLTPHFAPQRVLTHVESSQFRQHAGFGSRYDFLSGHVRLLAAEAHIDLRAFRWLTILREPFEHLASHLCWVRSIGIDQTNAFHRSHPEEIRQLSIEMQRVDFRRPTEVQDYLLRIGIHGRNLFHDCQTRYLVRADLSGGLDAAALDCAKRNLRRFDLVGTTEDLSAFLQHLCRMMNWEVPARTEWRNVHTERFGLDPTNPAMRAALAPFVRHDQALYRLATALAAPVA